MSQALTTATAAPTTANTTPTSCVWPELILARVTPDPTRTPDVAAKDPCCGGCSVPLICLTSLPPGEASID